MTLSPKAIFRFPLDVIFVTIDWIRALWLRFQRVVLRRNACCRFCVESGYHAESLRVCPAALKYGNPKLFRNVCSGVDGTMSPGDEFPCCTVESPYQSPARSILPAGLVLILFWGGLGSFLQLRFQFFTHLHQLAFTPAPEIAPVTDTQQQEDVAALEDRLRRLSLEDSFNDVEAAEDFMAEADRYFEAGVYNIAKLQYGIALKRNPDLMAAYRQLGLCHIEEGNFQTAQPSLLRALELNPEDLDTHLAMTEVAAALGDPEDALEHARFVLKNDPGNVEGLLRLVHFYQATGNAPQATLAADEALAAAPEDPHTLHTVAAMFGVFQETERAEALLERCLNLDPQHLDALTSMAGLKLGRGEIDAGKALLDRAATVEPDSLQVRALQAEIIGLEEGVGAAIESYQALVRTNPEFHAGANRLADLLMRTRQYDALYELAEDLAGRSDSVTAARGHLFLARLWLAKGFFNLAIETAEQAVAESAHAEGAQFVLAQAHLARTDYDAALSYLDPLHSKHPDQEIIHLMRIRCLLGLGQEAAAETSYDLLLERQPDSSAGIRMMGDYYFRQKDFAKAETLYQEALRRDPDNAFVRYDLSMLLAENNRDLNRSEALAQQMKEEDKENALYYDVLGWVYHQQGRSDEAIDLLKKAVAQVPREPIFRYHYGAALTGSDPTAARAQLAFALRLSTNFFGADKAQALLAALPQEEETAD